MQNRPYGPSRTSPDEDMYEDMDEDEDTGGPRIGRIRVTPTRVILLIAIFGSVGFSLYTLTVRDATQIPLLAAGLTLLGLVFGLLTLMGLVSTYRAGAAEEAIRAMFLAIGSGIASIIALGCFAGAVLLAQLWTSGSR